MPPLTMYTTSRGCYMLPTTQSHDYCVQSQQLLLGYILHCSTVQKQGQVTKGGGPKSGRRKRKGIRTGNIGEGWLFFLSWAERRKKEREEGQADKVKGEKGGGGTGGGGLLVWTLKPSMSAKTGKPISFMVERKYWLILLPPSPFGRMGCQFC